MFRKKSKVASTVIAVALVVGGIIGITNWDKDSSLPEINNGGESSLENGGIKENGIKIKQVSSEATPTSYGVQTFTYSVNPAVNTDIVEFKLDYYDGGKVENDIIDVEINQESRQVKITCQKVFTKQIIFTLYAKSNEGVNATITLDFKERLTVTQNLGINEGQPLCFSTDVLTTGGSILVDKTVKDENISLNTDFVNDAKSSLKKQFEEKEFFSPATASYYTNSLTYYGLDEISLNRWLTGEFTYQAFVESIYLLADYDWQYSDDEESTNVVVRYYLTDLGKDKFNQIFNGVTSIFDYSSSVNGYHYQKNFGLKIDELKITHITIEWPSSIVF